MRLGAKLVLALTFGTASANADTVPSQTPEDLDGYIRDGLSAARVGRCADAVPQLHAATSDEAFRDTSQETRRHVLSSLVYCALQIEDADTALRHVQLLLKMPGEATEWRIRQLFSAAYRTQNFTALVDSMRWLADSAPGAIDAIPFDRLRFIYYDMSRLGLNDAARYGFLQVLYEVGYKPASPFESTDGMMTEFARMAIEQRDSRTAKKVIMGITRPMALLYIRIDSRFDELRSAGVEPHLDLGAAARKHVLRTGELVANNPRMLQGYVAYSDALQTARRYKESLDAIEPIALRLLEPGAANDFVDIDEYENWALERYSDILARLGQTERADAIHFESVRRSDHSDDNVSQKINYAGNQFRKGNFRTAVATLAQISHDDTSDYGSVLIHLYMTCSIAMGGIQRDHANSLDFLLEKQNEFGDPVLTALLCLDAEDGAASNLIRRLEHPERRADALMKLQLFADQRERLARLRSMARTSPSSMLPGDFLALRLDNVRQRDDVRQAVDAVGRIESVPLDSGDRY